MIINAWKCSEGLILTSQTIENDCFKINNWGGECFG